MTMKRLIVNADDFGLTEKVNQAVADGHERGIITSGTLMANGLAFDSAVALARAHPKLGVGVHLNLTEGSPVSGPSSILSLVDGRGAFYVGPLALATKITQRKISLADVERELRAQIETVLAAGVRATHLDSHKHVHLMPPIFDLVIKLAQEYRIQCVRCPVECPADLIRLVRRNSSAWLAVLKQYVLGWALSALASSQKRKLERAGLAWTTHFYGITHTGFLDAESLAEILRRLPHGTSELMCHPGYVDAALKRTPTRLLRQRVTEIEALTRPEIKRFVTELGIELISYGALVGAVRERCKAVGTVGQGRLVREAAGGSSL
jgi:hopanoid biosynthesis associated protein HpnK